MVRKAFIAFLVLLIVLTIGEVWPRLTITSGIEELPPEHRAFASSAFEEALIFFGEAPESLFWTVLQVEEVRESTDAGERKCYEAIVRAYSLFGLP